MTACVTYLLHLVIRPTVTTASCWPCYYSHKVSTTLSGVNNTTSQYSTESEKGRVTLRQLCAQVTMTKPLSPSPTQGHTHGYRYAVVQYHYLYMYIYVCKASKHTV